MATKHWHVFAGLQGGYLPDVAMYCETYTEALECAKWEAEDWGEAHNCEVVKLDECAYWIGAHWCVLVEECDMATCRCECCHE